MPYSIQQHFKSMHSYRKCIGYVGNIRGASNTGWPKKDFFKELPQLSGTSRMSRRLTV